MLLANRSVAEHVAVVPKGKQPKVLPYRIHDVPDPEKLEKLRGFVAKFGYKVRTEGTKDRHFPLAQRPARRSQGQERRKTSWNSWLFAP